MKKSQNLAILQRISWGPASRPLAAGATSLGTAFEFGFAGKDDPTPANICQLRQVHGTRILLDSEIEGDQEGDGLMTRQGPIAVRTADCLPVLLGDLETPIALAIHAGWRGLAAGIIAEAIEAAGAAGANPQAMAAVLGPSISSACFEVGPEVVEAMASESLGLSAEQLAISLTKGQEDRWHVDLAVAAVFALTNSGISPEKISVDRRCTKSDPQLNSYRREGTARGNNINWIQVLK